MKNRIWHNILIRKTPILFLARLLLGGIFVYASIDKIAFPGDFARIIENYGLLPSFVVKPFAILLPWFELIFGVFLVAGFLIRESVISLTALLIIFLCAIGIQATKGSLEDCGCFDESSILYTSNIPVLILRDFICIGLGIFILLNKTNPNGGYSEKYPKK